MDQNCFEIRWARSSFVSPTNDPLIVGYYCRVFIKDRSQELELRLELREWMSKNMTGRYSCSYYPFDDYPAFQIFIENETDAAVFTLKFG